VRKGATLALTSTFHGSASWSRPFRPGSRDENPWKVGRGTAVAAPAGATTASKASRNTGTWWR